MTQHFRPNKQEFYTDEQIIAIVAETVQIFNELAPSQRQQVRRKQRGYFVDDTGTKRRPHYHGHCEDEAKYDNLDFTGG